LREQLFGERVVLLRTVERECRDAVAVAAQEDLVVDGGRGWRWWSSWRWALGSEGWRHIVKEVKEVKEVRREG
jgi:hypothetical protein